MEQNPYDPPQTLSDASPEIKSIPVRLRILCGIAYPLLGVTLIWFIGFTVAWGSGAGRGSGQDWSGLVVLWFNAIQSAGIAIVGAMGGAMRPGKMGLMYVLGGLAVAETLAVVGCHFVDGRHFMPMYTFWAIGLGCVFYRVFALMAKDR